MPEPIRVIAIGAHPDDCEYRMGGTAALLVQAGHAVKFVSVTNGDAGHHKIKGSELAARRYALEQAGEALAAVEARAVAKAVLRPSPAGA